MSYDVVVTKTVGEISVETKFKNYRDFLDWSLQGKVANKDCTNFITKKENLVRLTKENVRELVSEGDTVVIKDYNDICLDYGDTTKPYIVDCVEDLDYDGGLLLDLNRGTSWVDFEDSELEIYKVIKN